jgi:hypothetical protein
MELVIYSKEVKELIPVKNTNIEVAVTVEFADNTEILFTCCSIKDLEEHFSKMKASEEVVENYFAKVGER